MMEEEAHKLGMSLEEYNAARQTLSCEPIPVQYPVHVDPSPGPLPLTSNGMIGRRARCPLERYGRLVTSARDLPLRPPLPPGQVYDPFKQTIIFLGIDVGNPISYKLSPRCEEVGAEAWRAPVHLSVAPLSEESLHSAQKLSGQFHTTYE